MGLAIWMYVRMYIHMASPVRMDYICTDIHMTTKIFEIDGLPNFLRYGAVLLLTGLHMYLSLYFILYLGTPWSIRIHVP